LRFIQFGNVGNLIGELVEFQLDLHAGEVRADLAGLLLGDRFLWPPRRAGYAQEPVDGVRPADRQASGSAPPSAKAPRQVDNPLAQIPQAVGGHRMSRQPQAATRPE
jgi:hypothetical protein